LARRRDNTTLHTSLAGERSVWMGRRPKGLQDEHSFNAFVTKARRGTKRVIPGDNQLHLERHHRGYQPGRKTEEDE